MRELNNHELNQVAGSDMVTDVNTLLEYGLSQPEQTLTVVALSGGMLAGAGMAYANVWIAPVATCVLLGGWYFYTCSH